MKQIPNDEYHWLAAVTANLADDTTKLVYADWLEEREDNRSNFLRSFVAASQTMNHSQFPDAKGLPEEWLELIGYRIIERIAADPEEAEKKQSISLLELKERTLRLARPALRMVMGAEDEHIAIGASKIGGLPDLPADFPWPQGGECQAIYNSDTAGTDRLAGFMAQVNMSEIAGTQAARDLPAKGVLSFFCFQDIENDNPDVIGAKAIYCPDSSSLVRTKPTKELTEGNGTISARSLKFQETLDLPGTSEGPWTADLVPDPELYSFVFEHVRTLNFHNLLGYARATTGGDPTPSKQSRHLILLENAAGCRLHIQIGRDDLAACNFEKITLNWVDFD